MLNMEIYLSQILFCEISQSEISQFNRQNHNNHCESVSGPLFANVEPAARNLISTQP